MFYLQQFLADEAEAILGQLELGKDSYEGSWARVKKNIWK